MINRLPLTRIKIFIARVLYKIVRLIIRKNPVLVNRGGINYELDLTEGIDLSIFLFGGFQKHVYNHLEIDKNSKFIIIDIGGNIGSMSLAFAKMFPLAEIKAFEPTHFACERFIRNILLNPKEAERIELIQSFVSNSNDDNPKITAFASWKVGGENNKEEKHAIHLGTAKDTTGISAKTLDWFCTSNDFKNVKLIKIDTDGHEHKILEGAKETLIAQHPIIVFEIGQYVMNEHNVDTFFYLDFLNSINYELFNSSNLKKITRDNWTKIIPKLGTIDILAKPKS
jgi:FkbM family methyltransferase